MTYIPFHGRRGVGRRFSKEQFWRKTLSQFGASGQSIRQFCKTRGISEPSFYFWRRTLAQRKGASNPMASSEPVFLPVQVTAENNSRIEIVLGGGLRIRLGGPVDPLALQQVLAVLSNATALSVSKGKEGSSC
jgi:transposase